MSCPTRHVSTTTSFPTNGIPRMSSLTHYVSDFHVPVLIALDTLTHVKSELLVHYARKSHVDSDCVLLQFSNDECDLDSHRFSMHVESGSATILSTTTCRMLCSFPNLDPSASRLHLMCHANHVCRVQTPTSMLRAIQSLRRIMLSTAPFRALIINSKAHMPMTLLSCFG